MTDSDLKRINRVFAEELGRAPNGQPLYKWVRPRDLFYFIEYMVDELTPCGRYEHVDKYKRVTWEDRLGHGFPWIIATWQAPGTPDEWHVLYGDVIPYPQNGMYFPISGSQIPCDPSIEITMNAVFRIKQQLQESFETHFARTVAEADVRDEQIEQQSDDRIASDWPAFNCEVTVSGHDLKEPNT